MQVAFGLGRRWPARRVADAVFYLIMNGCPWRMLPRLELLWAEGSFTGGFREWLRRQLRWRLEVPHHRDWQVWSYGSKEKPRGLQVLPRRWIVERTFTRLGLSRRLSKDYEPAGNLGVYDVPRDGPDYATQAGGCGLRPFALVSPNILSMKLALRQRVLAVT
jgi:transposase